MRAARSAVAAAGILLGSAVVGVDMVTLAFAGDFEVGDARAAIEKARAEHGDAGAISALDAILHGPRLRTRDVEAAQTAIEFLPPETGEPCAARLLAATLRADPSAHGDAWRAAQDVRKRMFRRVDVENASQFLRELSAIYPTVPEYRRDLATILLDGSRRPEARTVLAEQVAAFPDDPFPVYQLARLEEEDGDLAQAAQRYETLVARRPQEIRAYFILAKIFEQTDPARARGAVARGADAAARSDSATERADWADQFASERWWISRAESDRANIRAMGAHQTKVIAVVLGLWAVALVIAARRTRRI